MEYDGDDGGDLDEEAQDDTMSCCPGQDSEDSSSKPSTGQYARGWVYMEETGTNIPFLYVPPDQEPEDILDKMCFLPGLDFDIPPSMIMEVVGDGGSDSMEHPRSSYCEWAQDLEETIKFRKWALVIYRYKDANDRWQWMEGQIMEEEKGGKYRVYAIKNNEEIVVPKHLVRRSQQATAILEALKTKSVREFANGLYKLRMKNEVFDIKSVERIGKKDGTLPYIGTGNIASNRVTTNDMVSGHESEAPRVKITYYKAPPPNKSPKGVSSAKEGAKQLAASGERALTRGSESLAESELQVRSLGLVKSFTPSYVFGATTNSTSPKNRMEEAILECSITALFDYTKDEAEFSTQNEEEQEEEEETKPVDKRSPEPATPKASSHDQHDDNEDDGGGNQDDGDNDGGDGGDGGGNDDDGEPGGSAANQTVLKQCAFQAWSFKGDDRKVGRDKLYRRVGSQLVETFAAAAHALKESKAWIWTSAVRGPAQQLLGDGIRKKGLHNYTWVGFYCLRDRHSSVFTNGGPTGAGSGSGKGSYSNGDDKELDDFRRHLLTEAHWWNDDSKNFGTNSDPDQGFRSRKAKIIIPDVSYLFPKGNQLWNDDPAEAVLKSVEGLYVKEPQGRTGLSPLRLPTPFITHLLVIDEKTEKKLEQAMELFCRRMDIIQGLMCINGSKTEVLDKAMRYMDNMHPVISFFNAGGASHDLAFVMVQHMERVVRKKRPEGKGHAPEGKQSGVGTGLGGANAWFFHRSQSFVATWRPVCQDWSVKQTVKIPYDTDVDFLIPIDISQFKAGHRLQKRIADCLAKAGVGAQDQELGHNIAERERIEQAWELYEVYYENSESQKRMAIIMGYLLITLNFSATAVAVFSTYLQYGGIPQVKDLASDSGVSIDKLFRVLVVLVPLLGGVLHAVINRFSPASMYAAYKGVALQIKSEIYKYRTRTGDYGGYHHRHYSEVPNRSKRPMGDDSGGCSIKDKLSGFNARGQMKSRAESLRSSRRMQFGENIVELTQQVKALELETKHIRAIDVDERIERRLGRFNEMRKKAKSHVHRSKSWWSSWKRRIQPRHDGNKQPDIEEGGSHDDGRRPLTAEKYVQFRLETLIHKYKERIPQLRFLRNCQEVAIYLIAAGSTMLGNMGLNIWMAVAVAVSGAISSAMEFQQVRDHLRSSILALSQLQEILVWWRSLSFVEKRKAENKEQLVKLTERAHLGAAANLVQSIRRLKTNSSSEHHGGISERGGGKEDGDGEGAKKEGGGND